MRDKVLNRDGGCTACGRTDNLQVHHIKSAAEHGPTTRDNLIVLCRDCHLEANQS